MHLFRRVALALALAFVTLTATITAPASPAAADGPALLPLISFFSPSRGDHFTTTQSVWTCQYFNTCADSADYDVVGIQGFVYNPANPQPPGTMPLYHWWNPTRGDNWLTTDPRWSGEVGDRRNSGGEYVLFRIEGYVETSRPFGGEALNSYWNPAEGDNAALATWRYGPPPGWTEYRREGFLLPPEDSDLQQCMNGSAHDFQDPQEWNAHGNLVNDWAAPAGLVDGDALRVDADPASEIRIDYWGHMESVFGFSWSRAAAGPVFDIPQYALIGRVTSGAMFVRGHGWFEANEWFGVVGTVDTGSPSASPCLLYESTGGSGQTFQLSFNDPTLSDNGGFAPVTVTQWF